MLQAFNSTSPCLKKRVEAGSPNALRARRKELEREVKKSEKRTREADARYAACAPARPPPRQKKRTADGQLVRDGQCEGTCKDGKRCRVGPGTFPCAKPLTLGSEACSRRAASAGPGKAPGARPSRPDPRLLPRRSPVLSFRRAFLHAPRPGQVHWLAMCSHQAGWPTLPYVQRVGIQRRAAAARW